MLFPHEVPLLQAARNIQKVALISNFVDRESERPALGPNDFLPLPGVVSISKPQKVPQKRKRKSMYVKLKKLKPQLYFFTSLTVVNLFLCMGLV